MPHDRPVQEKRLRDTYDFIVFGGEYSIMHAALIVFDGFVTGGAVTFEFARSEAAELGIDLAEAMASATPPVQPSETLYGNVMTFHNWEEPFPNVKIPLPNKFVPYIAARKREKTTPSCVLRNRGASDFKNHYLDIHGGNGSLMLSANQGSGTFWKLDKLNGSEVTLQNLGSSPFRNWYLDIDGHFGELMLNERKATGSLWRLVEKHGNVLLQNCANTEFKDYYLDIDGGSGALMLNKAAGSGCYWRMITV